MTPLRATRESGQSSIEYILLCAVLALVLGVGMVDDQSVLRQLLTGLQLAYAKFSYAVSLPY